MPINAERGLILDRNGAVVAENITTYDIYVRPVNVKDVNMVAKLLSEETGVEYNTVLKKASNKKTSEVLIKLQVPKENALRIINSNVNGIYLTQNNKRYYVAGDLLTQVLGYTTVDGRGQTGLELHYNDYLKGVDGKALTQTDAQGKELPSNINEFIPPITGVDLSLTIDLTMQTFVEDTLNKIMQEQKAKKASAIIISVQTGEVLAMGSKPSFNLNEPPRNDIALLNSLSKNSTITDVYEPGSTFKLLTLSAALEEGLTRLDEMFYCPGYRMVDNQKIKCWKTIGHGSQNLIDGVSNSCNCVFMDLGLRLGKEKLYDYLKKFGIGEKTGVDFMGESAGIMMPIKNVKNVDLARIAFGQAIAVTPLQLARAVSCIINGGNLYVPQFLKTATASHNKEEKTIFKNEPNLKRKVLSLSTSSKIRFMMKEAVEHANAVAAYVPGYTLGGKTGTAQKYENGSIAQGKYISSFVGFAPYENPQYTILLMVDEPGAGAYYGSIVAAPYGKLIFEQIFDYKQIPPINLEEELNKIKPTIMLPDFVGMTLSQAFGEIKKLGLICELQGEGGFVEEQFPKANVVVYGGAVVVLQTN